MSNILLTKWQFVEYFQCEVNFNNQFQPEAHYQQHYLILSNAMQFSKGQLPPPDWDYRDPSWGNLPGAAEMLSTN